MGSPELSIFQQQGGEAGTDDHVAWVQHTEICVCGEAGVKNMDEHPWDSSTFVD